jgi:hypothetical protein
VSCECVRSVCTKEDRRWEDNIKIIAKIVNWGFIYLMERTLIPLASQNGLTDLHLVFRA